MILTLGAGSVSQLGPMIVEKLGERKRRELIFCRLRIFHC